MKAEGNSIAIVMEGFTTRWSGDDVDDVDEEVVNTKEGDGFAPGRMRRGECAGSVCSGLPRVLEYIEKNAQTAKGKSSPSRRMCQPNWMSPVPEDQFQRKVVDRITWVIAHSYEHG